MQNKTAGWEPQNNRKTTEIPILELDVEEAEIITHDLSETKLQRVAEAWYQRNKHLPGRVAGASVAVAKVAGVVGLCAVIVGGTAYAIYCTAAQAALWVSAQAWTKPVLAIVLLSAGVAAAWQYSLDGMKRTEADRGCGQSGHQGWTHAGTNADKRTVTRTGGQTIIINQYNNKQ